MLSFNEKGTVLTLVVGRPPSVSRTGVASACRVSGSPAHRDQAGQADLPRHSCLLDSVVPSRPCSQHGTIEPLMGLPPPPFRRASSTAFSVGLFIHEFLVGPPVGCSSTLDDPILGVLGRGFEPRATLQQPGALSTGPCPTPTMPTFNL